MELRQEFIPDTNNKYSVREDGVVFSHFKQTPHKIVPLVDNNRLQMRLWINGKTKKRVLKKLVMDAFFEGKLPLSNNPRIYHLDDNHNNCRIDNLAYIYPVNPKLSITTDGRTLNKLRRIRAKYTRSLGDCVLDTAKKRSKQAREQLSDHYLASLSKLPVSDMRLIPWTLDLKRETIKIHRNHVSSTR